MIEAAISRIRSIVCVMLAAVLFLLSPGLACYSAAAAEFEGGAPKGAPTPLPAVNAGLSKGLNLPENLTTPELGLPGTELPGTSAELPILPASTLVPITNTQNVIPGSPAIEPQAEALEPVPGTPAATEAALTNLGKTLQPQIQAAGQTGNADPSSSGERIEQLLEGGKTRGSSDLGSVDAREISAPDELPNPYGLYQHAYPIAVAKAAELGKKPSQVYFYQASASVPGVNGASWKYAFYLTEKPMSDQELAKAKPATGDIVYVDFSKAEFSRRGDELTVSDDPHLDGYLQRYSGPAAPQTFKQTYDAPRVSVFRDAPLASDWAPFTADQTYFKMGSQTSAQGALDSARREGLTGGVSVSFKMDEEPATGAKDFWYRVYDDAGKVFAANGRTNEQIRPSAPAAATETAQQRLQRYAANGRDAGATIGVVASLGALWHLLSITPDSELMLKLQIIGGLAGLAVTVGVGVVTAQFGRLIGKLSSGVKAEKKDAAPIVVAPAETATQHAVATPERVEPAPVVAAGPETAEQRVERFAADGRDFGAAAGVAASLAALWQLFSIVPDTEMMLKAQIIGAIVGLAVVVGAGAATAQLGRLIGKAAAGVKIAAQGGWSVVRNGALAGAATVASSFLVGALTDANGWKLLMGLSTTEALVGGIALAAAAIASKGTLDLKQDRLMRFGAASLISAVVSGSAFIAATGWLSYTIAGTMKDKPAKGDVAPLYAEAYAAAAKAAAAKGYKPGQIKFAEGENQNPADPKAGWTFHFMAQKDEKSGKGEWFKAYLYAQDSDGFRTNAYSYGEATVPAGFNGSQSLTAKAPMASSLERAAKALSTPAGQLGVTLRLEGKTLWYVFETEAGARWGVNARTGKDKAYPASTVTAERIAAAVKSAVSYKGRPWSQTEYNMEQSMVENGLRRDGAGPAQIRLYYRLCGEAPVRPGGFNPWSGD